ncbi:MAG: trypsin-like peptidase domain-containing protein [Anaerolineaceae bacterium]
MKPTYKISTFLIVFTIFLASCSALDPSAILKKVNPKNVDEPPIQATEMGQSNQGNIAVEDNENIDPIPSSEAVMALESVYENVYQQVNPSVVNIQVQQIVNASKNPFFDFFGQQNNSQDQIQRGLGSGFIWDTEGHIVTNNHVIDSADKVTVTFIDGTTVTGKVVGADPNSDLAVVKVDVPASLLKPVTMSESSLVKVGQMAIAIGNPYGLEGSMTVGIVSAIGRTLPVNNNSLSPSPSYTIPDIIQTDAPINPGNSGGVLVNNGGNVIGVTSAIESASGANAGIGFAVPSDQVKKVIPSLISTGKYEYTYLGISGRTLSSELAKEMGLDANRHGILVGDVNADGPANKAGIKGSSRNVTIDGTSTRIGGDVIIQMDNQKIYRFEDLVSYLARDTRVGQTVTLTILRDKKEMKIDVKLEARPTVQKSAGTNPALPEKNPGNDTPEKPGPSQPVSGSTYLGIKGTDVTADIAQALNLDQSTQGVEVISVVKDSPADKAGLQGRSPTRAGDIITDFNDKNITGMSDLRGMVSEKAGGDVVSLKVIREGEEISVEVTLATMK